MKLLSGVVAGMMWTCVMAVIIAKTGIDLSNDAGLLSLAIVIAGAMAGED